LRSFAAKGLAEGVYGRLGDLITPEEDVATMPATVAARAFEMRIIRGAFSGFRL